MEQDEIYLIDLWRIFAREWRWFVGALALVLLATFGFSHLVKPQWEATAWIQIGQVAQTIAGQDQKVEPLLRIIERLQLVPFQDEILQSVGFDHDAPESKLYRSSMKLEPMPYAGPLIRMSVRANTPERARQLAAATVEHLQGLHRELEAGAIGLAQAHLAQIQSDLDEAAAERERLLQQSGAAAGDTQRKDPSTALLANMLLSSKNAEVRGLKQARKDLLDRLGPAFTYDTSLAWPIYVPDKRAFPNPALTWGVGGLIGVFLGMFAVVVRNAARRRSAKS
jgi:LPS O-antigen subunit length determinant protein (WzzB/FepE family)